MTTAADPPGVGLPILLVLRDGAMRLTDRGHVGFEDRSALHEPRSSRGWQDHPVLGRWLRRIDSFLP